MDQNTFKGIKSIFCKSFEQNKILSFYHSLIIFFISFETFQQQKDRNSQHGHKIESAYPPQKKQPPKSSSNSGTYPFLLTSLAKAETQV